MRYFVDPHTRFRDAERLFAGRRYREAAIELEKLLDQASAEVAESVTTGLVEARLLLARAYFHSAQLKGAERASRQVLDEDPTEAYAALLLARTLERANRPDEAEPWQRMAQALGAPGTDPLQVG